jgi:hypothetical protein
MSTWRVRIPHVGRAAAVLAVAAAALAPSTALAHEERETEFPDGSGSVPEYRPMVAEPNLVVCKPDSARHISRIRDRSLRRANLDLLSKCRFRHIQAAVDAVSERDTTIYVLPGTYREEPSRPQPDCAEEFEEGDGRGAPVMTYEEQRSCPHAQNLIGIFGDDNPEDDERACDAPVCGLQLEGTGERPEDVVIDGGFDSEGDFVKLNGIRADRADGVYFKNFTVQLFEFNSLYVIETDGFVIDDVVGRWNDEYGFLTFAVDHGLYKNCEAYGNGDSGIYPGSASDVNSSNEDPPPLERWAVEIKGCHSHHNTLGYSGTAGNSVYAHDNVFTDNAAGAAMDSLFPDHPGLPQDHAWFENNRIFANNENYYERYVHSGVCDRKPAERGYENGTVCPVVPVPVGTGTVVAGGNHNLFRANDVFDNWRAGFMLFHVPAALRGEEDPEKQFDTSHHNQYRDNRLGFGPDGLTQPNGIDQWWDDQGEGNCWQGNVSATGEVTSNSLHPVGDGASTGLPDCDSGGSWAFPTAPNPAKSAQIAPCATYDRDDPVLRDPPGCSWLDSPSRPEGREE